MRTNLNWSRNLHWKFFRPWKITICPHFALFTFYQIEALRNVVTNFTLILALLSNSLALNEKYQLRRQIFVVIQFLCKIFIFKNCSFQKPCRQVLIFSLSTYIDQKCKKKINAIFVTHEDYETFLSKFVDLMKNLLAWLAFVGLALCYKHIKYGCLSSMLFDGIFDDLYLTE